MRSQKAQCQAPPDNPETGDTYEYHSRERRSCAGQQNSARSIEHQRVHRRHSSSSSASRYIRVYTSDADSTNPISMEEECEYGGRVLLHAVSRWSRSPGCCGYISWCVFLVSVGFRFFSLSVLRAHTADCKYEATLPHVPLS